MQKTLGLTLFLLLMAAAPGNLLAHSGSHDAPPPPAEAPLPELPEEEIVHEGPLMGEAPVMEESLNASGAASKDTLDASGMAAMEANDPGPVDYGMGDLPSDTLGTRGTEGASPLWGDEPKLPGAEPVPMDLRDMGEHGNHDMPDHAAMTQKHVQPAEHEWNNTSRKGYGWALALVVLSALWFGFLDYKKPLE